MHRLGYRQVLLMALVPGLLASFGTASAAVTAYTSETQFVTDTGAPVVADFNGRAYGATAAFTLGGIQFSAHPPLNNLFIIDSSVPITNTNPIPTSRCLTGNGEDDIDMTLPSGTRAVGFNDITNAFAAPVVTLSAPDGTELLSYTLTQAPNRYGFVGFLSSTPIAKIRWRATGGATQNTAIDNVRVTTSPTETTTRTWGRVKTIYR